MYKDSIAKKVVDVITLCALGIYLVDVSLFQLSAYLPIPEIVETVLFITLFICAIFKILLACVQKKLGKFLLCIVILVVCIYSYTQVEYSFIPWLGVAIVASSEMDYRKILTLFLIVIGFLIFSNLLLGLLNISPNYVYFDGERVRSSLGFVYPTDFASFFLYFAIAFWVKEKKYNELFLLIPALFALYLAKYVAVSSTSEICSCLLIVGIIIDYIGKTLKEKNIELKILKKMIGFLLIISFPILAGITFASIYSWHLQLPIATTMNNLLHNRVSLSYDAILQYGIHPFGSQFDMIGNGGGTFADLGSYNFIDNSFALCLIRYGIVVFCLILFLWILLTYKAIKTDNYRFAIALAIIAVHSLSEHHFLEIDYNIFLLLPFTRMKVREPEPYKLKFNIILLIVSLLFICVGIYILPTAISCLRTFVEVFHYGEISLNTFNIYSLGFSFLIVLMIFMLFISINKTINLTFNKNIKAIICLLASIALIIVSAFGISNIQTVLNDSYEAYVPVFEQEADVLNTVISSKTGNLYSSEIPEYYQRYFSTIAYDLNEDEELVQYTNATIIVDSSLDSNILSNAGYKWLQISDNHAIYTNDSSVIDALTNAGYQLNDCYAKEIGINLADEAEMNGISLTEEGFYPINVNSSFVIGPNISLHNGDILVRCYLSGLYLDYQTFDDLEVLNFTVTAYGAETILSEQHIMKSFFDEFGNCAFTFTFSSQNSQFIEFKIVSINDASLNINGITYQRVSSY